MASDLTCVCKGSGRSGCVHVRPGNCLPPAGCFRQPGFRLFVAPESSPGRRQVSVLFFAPQEEPRTCSARSEHLTLPLASFPSPNSPSTPRGVRWARRQLLPSNSKASTTGDPPPFRRHPPGPPRWPSPRRGDHAGGLGLVPGEARRSLSRLHPQREVRCAGTTCFCQHCCCLGRSGC